MHCKILRPLINALKYQKCYSRTLSWPSSYRSLGVAVKTISTHQVAGGNINKSKLQEDDEPRGQQLDDLHGELKRMFPNIVHDVTQDPQVKQVPEVAAWLAKVLHYTVPNGGNNSAIDFLFAYKTLGSSHQLTPENLRKAKIMAWCVEMLVSVIFIVDDLMDGSEMRRGQPCWYRHENIGVAATNDCLLMENAIYRLLRQHFRNETYYLNVMETFNEACFQICIGQCLDLQTSQFGRTTDLNKFTEERYNTLVAHKSSDLFIYLPVALAMRMHGMNDQGSIREILNIAHFIQVENDYLDCYGDPNVTGKEGSDIKNGAMSWLAVTALSKPLSQTQRQILQDCYGRDDLTAEDKVKQLYEELGMQQLYAANKDASYNQCYQRIQNMPPGPLQVLFMKILNNIYKHNSYACA